MREKLRPGRLRVFGKCEQRRLKNYKKKLWGKFTPSGTSKGRPPRSGLLGLRPAVSCGAFRPSCWAGAPPPGWPPSGSSCGTRLLCGGTHGELWIDPFDKAQGRYCGMRIETLFNHQSKDSQSIRIAESGCKCLFNCRLQNGFCISILHSTLNYGVCTSAPFDNGDFDPERVSHRTAYRICDLLGTPLSTKAVFVASTD